MPRTGLRTNKRKFIGNRFSNLAKKARLGSETDSAGQSTSSELCQNNSASARKIGNENLQNVSPVKAAAVTGYRFVDMEILSVVFQQMVCKECGNSAGIVLEDNPRKGKVVLLIFEYVVKHVDGFIHSIPLKKFSILLMSTRDLFML